MATLSARTHDGRTRGRDFVELFRLAAVTLPPDEFGDELEDPGEDGGSGMPLDGAYTVDQRRFLEIVSGAEGRSPLTDKVLEQLVFDLLPPDVREGAAAAAAARAPLPCGCPGRWGRALFPPLWQPTSGRARAIGSLALVAAGPCGAVAFRGGRSGPPSAGSQLGRARRGGWRV